MACSHTSEGDKQKSMVTLLPELNQWFHPVTALQQSFQMLCSWTDDTMSQYPRLPHKHYMATLVLQTRFVANGRVLPFKRNMLGGTHVKIQKIEDTPSQLGTLAESATA